MSALGSEAVLRLNYNCSVGKIQVGATTILIIAAETAFVASIALLGKEAWGHIKAIFKIVCRQTNLDRELI